MSKPLQLIEKANSEINELLTLVFNFERAEGDFSSTIKVIKNKIEIRKKRIKAIENNPQHYCF